MNKHVSCKLVRNSLGINNIQIHLLKQLHNAILSLTVNNLKQHNILRYVNN